MSNNIGIYAEFALLSQASYSDFQDIGNNNVVRENLQSSAGATFTEIQASIFVDQSSGYTGLHFEPTNSREFSASLFQSRGTGDKTLVIRGFDDILADGLQNSSVVTQGIAIEQLVSLYNLYQRLITPESEEATQLKPKKPGSESSFNHNMNIFMSSSNCKRNCHGPFAQTITA